jgi:hypothetical protein
VIGVEFRGHERVEQGEQLLSIERLAETVPGAGV